MAFMFVIGFALAGSWVGLATIQNLGWPYWTYHATVILVGVVLYFISNILTASYIGRRTPELANDNEIMPGIKNWELTAGTGVVPKWVSMVGLVGIAFILASPFELVAWLFRTMGRP